MKKKIFCGFACLMFLVTGVLGTYKAAGWTSSYDKFNYGVNTIALIWYRQYSEYYHANRYHYANAMMNDKYTGRIYADAGKTAGAYTPWYGGYGTHNSYYGW